MSFQQDGLEHLIVTPERALGQQKPDDILRNKLEIPKTIEVYMGRVHVLPLVPAAQVLQLAPNIMAHNNTLERVRNSIADELARPLDQRDEMKPTIWNDSITHWRQKINDRVNYFLNFETMPEYEEMRNRAGLPKIDR